MRSRKHSRAKHELHDFTSRLSAYKTTTAKLVMMQDYSKLTVAKLKDELDRRGLPKSGLKAALVQRLVEADDEAAKQTPALPDEEAKPTEQDAQSTNEADPLPSSSVPSAPVQETPIPTVGAEVDQGQRAQEAGEGASFKSDVDVGEDAQNTSNVQQNESKPSSATSDQILPGASSQEEIHPQTGSQEVTGEDIAEAQLPTPAQTQTESFNPYVPTSTQTSVAPEELAEDSRKRKRRSQSPPPSSLDTSKRLRHEVPAVERPDVKLPEDTPTGNASSLTNGHHTEDIDSQGAPNNVPQSTAHAGPPGEEEANEATKPSKSRSTTPTRPAQSDSQPKPTPPDRRFQSLSTSSAQKVPAASPTLSNSPDRDVPPSQHPATSALYIRNLMRPLNPSQLKSHLATLAHPPSSSSTSPPSSSSSQPPETTIPTFHLDSIRSHALVRFTSVTAASRVRAQLHDRVWPSERDRKPLHIDFVPEEKLDKWIDVQLSHTGPGGTIRASGNKRWEIVYEVGEEEGSVEAYMQEVGAGGGKRAPAPVSAQSQGPSQGPISGDARVVEGRQKEQGEREREPDKTVAVAAEPTVGTSSKEFKALDDLFMSTAGAKPKLYYLPVDNGVVERRRQLLDRDRDRGGDRGSKAGGSRDRRARDADRRGGGGDEMRRFSFDGERIVDKGPEFGYGRGGRGRGGGYRGRGGGGGGYRGDVWRGSVRGRGW